MNSHVTWVKHKSYPKKVDSSHYYQSFPVISSEMGLDAKGVSVLSLTYNDSFYGNFESTDDFYKESDGNYYCFEANFGSGLKGTNNTFIAYLYRPEFDKIVKFTDMNIATEVLDAFCKSHNHVSTTRMR